MNSTRLIWSKEFHCSRRDVDIIPIILLSIFFCSLPVLFYVSNKIHGTKTEMKLLKRTSVLFKLLKRTSVLFKLLKRTSVLFKLLKCTSVI